MSWVKAVWPAPLINPLIRIGVVVSPLVSPAITPSASLLGRISVQAAKPVVHCRIADTVTIQGPANPAPTFRTPVLVETPQVS
jgi:hypothetical protein